MGCALAAGTILAASVSLVFILHARTHDSCCPPYCSVGACCPHANSVDDTCTWYLSHSGIPVVQQQQHE